MFLKTAYTRSHDNVTLLRHKYRSSTSKRQQPPEYLSGEKYFYPCSNQEFIKLYVNNEFECFIMGCKHETRKPYENENMSASVFIVFECLAPLMKHDKPSCLHGVSAQRTRISLAHHVRMHLYI